MIRVRGYQLAVGVNSPSVQRLVAGTRSICIGGTMLLKNWVGDSRKVVAHKDGCTFTALFSYMTALAQD